MASTATAEKLPVLVVDDDSALIRTLADILRMHGYQPSTAVTAREGLELAARTAPVLAVVDLRLPDMDGMELASRLHALSDLTEVVVLTGNASVESAVAALREHSVDYLIKPVNVDRLLQVVSLASERWQRRQAEDRLRDSDERFRRVVESDMLGILFWDASGVIHDANDAVLRMLGFTRDDLMDGVLDWSRLTPEEYRARDREKMAEIARTGVIPAYEKEFFRKDGTRVPILIGAATLERRTDRGVAFVLDITDRKHAEQAVESRARQQAAVAGLGQRALAAQDINGLFDDAASLVAATLNAPVACVLERRSDGAGAGAGAGSLALRAAVGLPRPAGDQGGVAVDGATHWGLTLVEHVPVLVEDIRRDDRFGDAALLRAAGAVSGMAVVIPGAVHPFGVLAAHDAAPRRFTMDDVHFLQAIAHVLGSAAERYRTEMAFRQSQRMEAVGRLASGVSHDFNNMLAAITGFGEMVYSSLEPQHPSREDVGEILKAARSAASLTRQLLAFSRKQVLQPRTLQLNDVVREMEKMVQRLIGENVTFATHLDPQLAWMKADPGQLEQVILNLCVNARDAMPRGGRLTIETGNTELDLEQTQAHGIDAPGEPGAYVMLAVSDTGVGMDAETRTRIFEPFFTTKPPGEGTGLGLATVYGIVKQSGGDIWVYSEPGAGTTFKLFFPRLEMSDQVQTTPASASSVGGSETILVAEDEDAIRRVLKRLLESSGYTVLVAENGADAERLANEYQGQIDLMVTDVQMPGLSGPEVVARIRQGRPQMRVLYLSGYTGSTVVGEGLLDADAHFLQKPFASGALARKVRATLDAG